MSRRQELIRDLDAMTRRLLFVKEKGRCYFADTESNYQCGNHATEAAHIFGRTALATRWDTEPDGNVHLLCRAHHNIEHECKLKPSYAEVFIAKNGEDAYIRLQSRVRRSTNLLNHQLAEKEEAMRDEFNAV